MEINILTITQQNRLWANMGTHISPEYPAWLARRNVFDACQSRLRISPPNQPIIKTTKSV
ncbi:MAG: hypothetical protein Q4Q37_03040 [Methanobrevibacter sp.]|nr:hypothetical protein [Methanobrevibacter sp.]